MQVTEDPPVMTYGVQGQSQPASGFLEVWKLAHAREVIGARLT